MIPLLTIGIPQFKEKELLKKCLNSIDTQIGIDFKDVDIIICNDASDKEYIPTEDFLNSFINIKPKLIINEINSGPGITRQNILDIASSLFITFIDADDVLATNIILSQLSQFLKEKPRTEVLYTSWLEEVIIDNKTMFNLHSNENSWLFGKLFNIDFLRYNKISFHPDLRIQEDSYFIGNARCICKKFETLDNTSYIWTYNPKSITRINNGEYTYKGFPTLITAIRYHLQWLMDNKYDYDYQERFYRLLMYTFFQLHLPIFKDPKIKNYITDIELELYKFMSTFPQFMEKFDKNVFNTLYNQERQLLVKHNLFEEEPFIDFINRILKTYKES